MEQKKILWIVVAVSVFILIIFGTALVLYAPSRSSGPSLQQAATVAPASKTATNPDGSQNRIDPDSWVREPGKTPGLDTGKTPAPGNINLTIVNGDNAEAKYGTMDVSGLTKSASDAAPDGQTATPPVQGIPGQTDTPTTAPAAGTTDTSGKKPAAAVTTPAGSAPAPVKGTKPAAGQTSAKPAATTATAATKTTQAKTDAKKPASGPEYWIQTGSFSNKLNAEKARETLTARYLDAEIFTKDSGSNTNYRVRVGPYKTKAEADYWLGTVKGIPEFSGSYVSEIKPKK